MTGATDPTTATDVYAFAMTCIEILSRGDIPWRFADDTSIMRFVLGECVSPFAMPTYVLHRRRPAPQLSFVVVATHMHP
jgi:hypothetical protein